MLHDIEICTGRHAFPYVYILNRFKLCWKIIEMIGKYQEQQIKVRKISITDRREPRAC